jgi:hypothetical protein
MALYILYVARQAQDRENALHPPHWLSSGPASRHAGLSPGSALSAPFAHQ